MNGTNEHGRDIRNQLGQREYASGLMCPACKGGNSHERSVTAWRQGLELGAKCWRNKCPWWGKWDLIEVGGMPKPGTHHGSYVKRYSLDTLPLTDATVAALEVRYGLQAETMRRYGLRQTSAGQACYCPVQGPSGDFRGWIRRWLNGTRPKVKSFPADTHPEGAAWQAWFRPGFTLAAMGRVVAPGGLVVAVEDVFSAMRLAEAGIAAVSLLGTSLSAVKVLELRQHASTIVVALDADAYQRAISFGLRYTVHVRRLATDIKDMTEEQLKQWTHSLLSSLRVSDHETPAT